MPGDKCALSAAPHRWPDGGTAPQFLLTICITAIYKTQTLRIEKFVFCIHLNDCMLTEIAAQMFSPLKYQVMLMILHLHHLALYNLSLSR